MLIEIEVDGIADFKGQAVLSELERWISKYNVTKFEVETDQILRKTYITIESKLAKISTMLEDFTESLRKQMWFERPRVISIQLNNTESSKFRDILTLGEI